MTGSEKTVRNPYDQQAEKKFTNTEVRYINHFETRKKEEKKVKMKRKYGNVRSWEFHYHSVTHEKRYGRQGSNGFLQDINLQEWTKNCVVKQIKIKFTKRDQNTK